MFHVLLPFIALLGTIVLWFILVSIITIIVYIIVNYVLDSLSTYFIAKSKNEKKLKLSFIPFYNKYYLGKMVDNKGVGITNMILGSIELVLIIIVCCIKDENLILLLDYLLIICIFISFVLDIIIGNNIYKIYKEKLRKPFNLINIFTFGFTRTIFNLYVGIRLNKK